MRMARRRRDGETEIKLTFRSIHNNQCWHRMMPSLQYNQTCLSSVQQKRLLCKIAHWEVVTELTSETQLQGKSKISVILPVACQKAHRAYGLALQAIVFPDHLLTFGRQALSVVVQSNAADT